VPTLEKVHRQHALMNEQRTLEKTSRHLSYLLEASPVVLYTLESSGGDYLPTWVSANISRLFGFPVVEALKADWWSSHVHPDDLDEAYKALDVVERDGVVAHEYRLYDRQGRLHWVHDEIRLLPTGRDGTRRLLGAWQDVTAKKRDEQVQETRIAALDSLISGTALRDVLQQVAEDLENILADTRVSVLLYDANCNRLVTAAAPSLPAFFNDAVEDLQPVGGRTASATAAAPNETLIVEDIYTHPDWTPYVELSAKAGIRACWSVPIRDEAGVGLGTFGIYHERPRKPTESELRLINEFARIAGLAVQRANTEATLRQAAAVFDNTQEGIVITDLTPRIIAVNRAYTEITGYSRQETMGRNPAVLQSGRQDESFYQTMWASLHEQGHWQGEIWNRRKNGEVYPQLLTISTVRDADGHPKNYVGVMTDISQIKQSEADLERLAHYDPLTDLPNRLLTHSRLEHALVQARREGTRVAVLFLDLDRFKNVNDSLGHPTGDCLLKALTKRLASRLRDEDSFGRLGGDEFLIVLSHARRLESAASIARELISLLEEPFALENGSEIYVGVSIGISVYPQDGDKATQLIQHADAAMYQAKEQGRNTFRFYTPALTEAANRRIELESRLRRAVAQHEFVLHYQPQVSIEHGMIVGCEALLRWNDPDKGLVPPADFIPLAEETGLIIPLGEWLMQAACAQFRQWIDQGMTDICLSVNLSGRQLQHPEIVEVIGKNIRRHNLPAERLKLEITESLIMAHGEEAETLLRAIKSLGVKLSIDDFGTGYSSLAYLKRFPIDELKIDRSFVRDIPTDKDDTEIAATIIAMAKNLRLNVVAEGVETEQQAAFLAERGCDYYQGYLFSPALPAAEFEALLRARNAGRT
jgi:diguanylate cyclase (GGDEF)-like protein/PAS domain S-box-containing protein